MRRTLLYIISVCALFTAWGLGPASAQEPVSGQEGAPVWEIPDPYKDIQPLVVFESREDSVTVQQKWLHELEEEELSELWALRETFSYTDFNSSSIHYRHPDEIVSDQDTIWIQLVDSGTRFVIPAIGRMSSRFGPRWGRMHYGTDIAAPIGDTIFAAFDGVVRVAQRNYSYGNIAIIFHKNGLETYYAHMSALLVQPNQLVKAGQPIGLSGNTGRSRGPHLHFEVRYLGVPIDAQYIIDFEKGVLLAESFPLCKGTLYGSSSSGQKYHKIRQGETLSSIARKYHTSVQRLKAMNGIKGNTIRAGSVIRVR